MCMWTVTLADRVERVESDDYYFSDSTFVTFFNKNHSHDDDRWSERKVAAFNQNAVLSIKKDKED